MRVLTSMTAQIPAAQRSDSVGIPATSASAAPLALASAAALALTISGDRGFFEVRHRSRATVDGNSCVRIRTFVGASPSAEGSASLG
jgi:hypothetical protein